MVPRERKTVRLSLLPVPIKLPRRAAFDPHEDNRQLRIPVCIEPKFSLSCARSGLPVRWWLLRRVVLASLLGWRC